MRIGWLLRLVETGVEGSGQSVGVLEINCPGDFGDLADLGLTLLQGNTSCTLTLSRPDIPAQHFSIWNIVARINDYLKFESLPVLCEELLFPMCS
jgi:hypothetical protein